MLNRHVLSKSQYFNLAKELSDTAMMISDEGEQYLGGAMDTASLIQQFVQERVKGWVKLVEKLSKFAMSKPHQQSGPICKLTVWTTGKL